MIYQVPFEAEHLARMQSIEQQSWVSQSVAPAQMQSLEGLYASTLMQDGKPLACAGAVPLWQGRAMLWAVLSVEVSRRVFFQLHVDAKRFLAGLPFRRLEATVLADFENGHRWVRALGFEVESPLLRKYGPLGEDHVGYVLLK